MTKDEEDEQEITQRVVKLKVLEIADIDIQKKILEYRKNIIELNGQHETLEKEMATEKDKLLEIYASKFWGSHAKVPRESTKEDGNDKQKSGVRRRNY